MRPYLRAANLTWHGIDTSDVNEMNFTDDEVTVYRLRPGDVLLSEASGSASEVGKPGVWHGQLPGDVCLQNTLLRVRPEAGVDSQYLYYRLLHEAMSGGFARSARGVGIHHLGSAKLAALVVELPPTTEQQRVVTVLDEMLTGVESARAGLGRARRLVATLRRAVLRAAVEGRLVEASHGSTFELAIDEERARPAAAPLPVQGLKLPAGWVLHSLDELTDAGRKAAYGVLQPGGHVPGGVPLVRVGDIEGGKVAEDGMKRIAEDVAAKYPRTRLRGGEVLLTLVGTIGRAAVAPSRLRDANVARAVGVLPLTPAVNAHFVALALQAEPYQSALTARSHEVARKTLNLEDVRSFPVPLPSRSAQDEIVAEADRLLTFLSASSKALDRQERLLDGFVRASLQAAFAGRLSSQDPSDEPADLLIKRITETRTSAPAARTRRGRTVTAARGPRRDAAEETA
jgi:type I restriction enzyme S subunit